MLQTQTDTSESLIMPKYLFLDNIFKVVKVISESLTLDMFMDFGYIIRLVTVEQRLLGFFRHWEGSYV